MSQETWPNGSSADLAELAGRRDALRQAAGLPGADPRELLDAAFAELDAAVEMLAKLVRPIPGSLTRRRGTRILRPHSARKDACCGRCSAAPAPLFLLEPDGAIRRANNRAGELIGTPPGYATGKPLNRVRRSRLPGRVQSQLAAATRTGVASRPIARCSDRTDRSPRP